MMKKKFIKLSAILSVVFLGVLEMGWRFFNMEICWHLKKRYWDFISAVIH